MQIIVAVVICVTSRNIHVFFGDLDCSNKLYKQNKKHVGVIVWSNASTVVYSQKVSILPCQVYIQAGRVSIGATQTNSMVTDLRVRLKSNENIILLNGSLPELND